MGDERLDTEVNTHDGHEPAPVIEEPAPAADAVPEESDTPALVPDPPSEEVVAEVPADDLVVAEPPAVDVPVVEPELVEPEPVVEPEAVEAQAVDEVMPEEVPSEEVPSIEDDAPTDAQEVVADTAVVPVPVPVRPAETDAQREVRERLERLERDERERFGTRAQDDEDTLRESVRAATAPLTKAPPAPPTPSAPPAAARTSVLLLGSGELGRELTLAFQRLGVSVIAADSRPDAPAHQVADRAVVVDLHDAAALTALVEREAPDYVVADAPASAGVAIDALIAVSEAKKAEVVPTARSTRLSVDREGLRRLAADELGLPTSPFWFAGSVDELGAVVQHAGFPLLVKPSVAVGDEGQSVLLRPDDIEPAWHRAIAASRPAHRVLVESVVEIDYEVTLLTVRSGGQYGPTLQFCEPIGHRQGDGGALQAWQPQVLKPAALDAAKSIAARIVNALGGRGVYGVELLVRGDEVYFADISARPHDTGLVTLRTQRLSEFELHARAILGLPLDTIMVTPGAAEVVYGRTGDPDERGVTERVLTEALGTPESDVRLFSSDDGAERRRVGVALATAADVATARERAGTVAGALRTLK